RYELVHAGGGSGDRPWDRGLPREGKRLERHRLQLPGRPLRHGLRGPWRRDDAQRDRCPRPRLQHGHGRRLVDRQLPGRLGGALGGAVRFQARLTAALSWTVTVKNAAGTVVASKAGTSQIVDWSWNSAGAGKGPFAWTIASGNDVLPATGTLGGKLPAPAPT